MLDRKSCHGWHKFHLEYPGDIEPNEHELHGFLMDYLNEPAFEPGVSILEVVVYVRQHDRYDED